jgi:hypothetical protein
MPPSNFASRLQDLRLLLIRHGVLAGCGIALTCLAVGGLGLLSNAPLGRELTILGVGAAIGWGVTWAVYLVTVSRPLTKLIDSAVSLAEADTSALSDTMAAIAEGDLTGKVAMRRRRSRAHFRGAGRPPDPRLGRGPRSPENSRGQDGLRHRARALVDNLWA